MRARVKQDCRQDAVRSAGMIYSKFEWHDVPDWAAEEVSANLLLEIEEEAEPATVEDKAARLVVRQPGRKGRKL